MENYIIEQIWSSGFFGTIIGLILVIIFMPFLYKIGDLISDKLMKF
jgi:preprotein translocase subunit SecD